jgi:hypothetical protein
LRLFETSAKERERESLFVWKKRQKDVKRERERERVKREDAWPKKLILKSVRDWKERERDKEGLKLRV